MGSEMCIRDRCTLLKLLPRPNYDLRELDSFTFECEDDNFEPLTNFEVEQLLNKIKLTAVGCDGMPA